MDKDTIIGNATTIIKCASMIVAGAVIGLATSYGLQLPWNESQIAEVITALVFAILAYYDARYPNTFINKSVTKLEVTPTELEEAIKTATDETSTQTETQEETVVEEDDQQ